MCAENGGRLPLRLRMDDGTENGGIELLLLSFPECKVKRGTSKHNQRIERAWRYVKRVIHGVGSVGGGERSE